jgi:hypothetical protein
MSEQEQIPWGEDEGLGEAWFTESAAICNATSAQKIMAACLHAGWTATASARRAGYAGSEDGIRQAGHRASHSTAVVALLGMAHSVSGVGPTGHAEMPELKGILSRVARSGDTNSRLRACETLVKIHQHELEREREHPAEMDIRAEIAEIAKLSPELAKSYAESKGIKWGSDDE